MLEVDDFGYNDVSWNNPDMITPELARLAQEGVILDTFYTAPRCSPSRQEYGGTNGEPAHQLTINCQKFQTFQKIEKFSKNF